MDTFILKKVIKKLMPFSIGTLVGLLMITSVTSCESCNSKPATDGKVVLTTDKDILNDANGKLDRDFVLTCSLTDEDKTANKSAILANYKLRVELKAIGGELGKSQLKYEAYDAEGKGSTPSIIVDGTTLDDKDLTYFLKTGENGTLDHTETLSAKFTFIPAENTTSMTVIFQILEKNNENALVGIPRTVHWNADPSSSSSKIDNEQETLLKEVKIGKNKVETAKKDIEALKDKATKLEQGTETETEQVQHAAMLELDKAQKECDTINELVIKLAGKSKLKEAEIVQKEAQDLFKEIEVVRMDIDKILISKNSDLFLERVKQSRQVAKDESTKVLTALQDASQENTAESLVAVEVALKAAQEAAEKAAAVAEQLKETSHQAEAATEAKMAKDFVETAQKAYEDALLSLEFAKVQPILQEARDNEKAAKAEVDKVLTELQANTPASLLEAEAAVKAAKEITEKVEAAAVKLEAAAVKLNGTCYQTEVEEAALLAKQAAETSKKAYDDAHAKLENNKLQSILKAEEAAKQATGHQAKVEEAAKQATGHQAKVEEAAKQATSHQAKVEEIAKAAE